MVNVLEYDRQSGYGIRHFVADVEKDVPTICVTSLEPGSTVFVIEKSQTYMLNSQKIWIKVQLNGGMVHDGGGVVPETPPPGNKTRSYDGGMVKK